MQEAASFTLSSDQQVIVLNGAWKLGGLHALEAAVERLKSDKVATIDASALTALDIAGAYFLLSLQQRMPSATIMGLQDKSQALLTLVQQKNAEVHAQHVQPARHNFLYRLGKRTVFLSKHLISFLSFLGEVMFNLLFLIIHPFKLQWRSLINEIDVGGYRALPIIAVMMALIGVVVAYQLGVQLQTYAANAYVVDLSGVAILREFSPLIASVIIAGRTSTSFAALIGTMKVNEELDALRTMGFSPVERLVMPKILGLLIALPLLVVWGDVFGMLGSMIMAKSMMGINFHAFLIRFQQQVAIKHLYLGLVKTPVFALIIAGIGCYQGFQASGSAQSVGERTTTAAVQSIFLIILADGIFSIVFNWLGI